VTLVEPIGSEAYVHLRAGELALVARVDAERRPEVGATVHVMFPPEHSHYFDAATGERLSPT
jgi:ABC-type sugar transport system ATPase subunit